MDVYLSALLDLVPAQYFVYALLVLKAAAIVHGVSSWLAPFVKRGLGAPSPNDSRMTRVRRGAAVVLDFLAANTQRLADKVAQEKAQKRIGELEAAGLLKGDALKAAASSLDRAERVIAEHESSIAKLIAKAGKQ